MQQMNHKHFVLSTLVMLFLVVSVSATPDQPNMQSAKLNLQNAKANLIAASPNKGGHRAKAINLVNEAIAEVNRGIAFDRRHNHTTVNAAPVDQPHMQAALEFLRSAKSDLERATTDKGGHRVNAIRLVDQAIDEVKKGIEAGE
jgi:hypothetical protein